ncbi:hypothetical protein P4U78_17305 [Bacillus pseudomycoides]|nr:hypothetical protein [Bacillus pseudomycoides]EEM16613.1 transcriptional regulator, AraC [Bacillus pseudomycoides DSM 12442]MED1597264.1 hypothetical protein [Bacillus pseudomycoides]MED4713380.1 hypothetical protein [Bacillus pseudomycoides]
MKEGDKDESNCSNYKCCNGWRTNVKFVDEGHSITSGGISSGINMSFHVVKNLLGVEIAEAIAKRMEYDIELCN